jgi:hypothetical protein
MFYKLPRSTCFKHATRKAITTYIAAAMLLWSNHTGTLLHWSRYLGDSAASTSCIGDSGCLAAAAAAASAAILRSGSSNW